MDFSFSDEQAMLADSVARYIDNDYDFEKRMKTVESDADFDADVWATFAELGWTAMLFDEDDGGFGGDAVELMLIMEQLGRGLVVEPFLANVVLAGGIIKRASQGDQRTALIEGIIDGSRQLALAFAEPQARYNVADIRTSAVSDGADFVLNGKKNLVLNGGSADTLIVPARTSGNQTDEDGITLFLVPAEADGVNITRYKTVDAQGAAEVTFTDVRAPGTVVVGDVDTGFEALAATIDEATLAVCAEAVGIIQTMHDKTVEYSKSRVQFGVPIGSFQALQHRMVETLMLCEQTRSLLYWTVMLCQDSGPEASSAISALKYQIGTAGKNVAQESVQLHGGMGVTWELDIAHYFKRHSVIETLFGNADMHLDRFANAA